MGVFRSGASPRTAEAGFTPAEALDDEGAERGRQWRFPQRRLSSAAEPGFTPGEALDDGWLERGRQ
jgi:hypothetical protein